LDARPSADRSPARVERVAHKRDCDAKRPDAALHDIRTTVSSGQSWSSILCGVHHDVLLASRTASVPHVAESLRPAASVVPRFRMPAPIEPLPAGVAGRRLVSVRTLPVAAADPLARDWSLAAKPTPKLSKASRCHQDSKRTRLRRSMGSIEVCCARAGTACSRPIARVFRATAAPGCRDKLLQRFHSCAARPTCGGSDRGALRLSAPAIGSSSGGCRCCWRAQ
jgi:hypothetical protein